MKLRIDAARVETLRAVHLREKASLQALQNDVSGDLAKSADIRREILSLERQLAKRANESLERRIAMGKAEKAKIEARIEYGEQSIEIARERCQAALQLRRSCEEYLSQVGGA